jgi:hypothetical protein
MFCKASGVSRIGTASKQQPSVCWRMISKNNDGRHPHSRMLMHCLESEDLVNSSNFPSR